MINQDPTPVGAAAPVGPETVAVNEIVEPSDAVVALATTATVGTELLTVVVVPEVGDVAK